MKDFKTDFEKAQYFRDMQSKFPDYTALEIEIISIRLEEGKFKTNLEELLTRCKEFRLPFSGVCSFIESFFGRSEPGIKVERKYQKWADTDLEHIPRDPPLQGNLGELLKR